MNKVLLNQLYLANAFTKFFKTKAIAIPRKTKKQVEQLYHLDLVNPAHTFDYDLKGEKLRHFFHYWTNDDIGKKIISAEFVVAPKWSDERVKAMVADIMAKDKRIKNTHFYVPTNSKLYKQLIKLGARSVGAHLFATVQDGLDYLSQYDFDRDIEICEMTKADLEEAIELEYLSHKYSETSRCENMPRRMFRGFFNYLMNTKKKVILAKEDGKIIGLIVPSVNHLNVGHFMSISVHHQEQGRGVGKLLYYEALKYFKLQNVKVYSGVSTTSQVLGLSKRLGRVPLYTYLEISRN